MTFEFDQNVIPNWDNVGINLHQELNKNYYHHYFDIIKKFNVKSVVEIGVRGGYTAYAMLSANPKMKFLGYDIDKPNPYGYVPNLFDYAKNMLPERFPEANIELLKMDTQKLKTLPGKFDLAHIDGEHSFEGCLHDLKLCTPHVRIILADDYDYVTSIRKAVDTFLQETGFSSEYLATYRGHMLIFTKRLLRK